MSDATPRPTRKRLDAFESIFQVASLTIRRTLRGKRLFGTLVFLMLPAALAFLVRSRAPTHEQAGFFYGMLSVFHFGIAVPIVALTFATQFPWPEAEEGTLTYWFTSPVRRWTVHLGRYVAALVFGSLVLPVSVLAIGLPLDAGADAKLPQVMRAAIAATLLVYPAYLALFWLVATWFRRGLVFGVIYVLVENLLSVFPGTIVNLALVYYARSQVSYSVPDGSRNEMYDALMLQHLPASAATSILTFVVVTVIALGASLFLVETIEYRGRTAQPG